MSIATSGIGTFRTFGWPNRPTLAEMSGSTYSDAGEAAMAYTQARGYIADLEVRHLETDGRWAAAVVITRSSDGEVIYLTVLMSNRDSGWTVQGSTSGSSCVGSLWVLAPGRGEPGHDGRKGVAAFTMSVPQDVDQLRVRYRPRRLSPRHIVKPVAVVGGEAFVTVWDCHSSWGVTRVEARRGGHWQHVDHARLPFRFESVWDELLTRWRARRGGDGWFTYEPRRKDK